MPDLLKGSIQNDCSKAFNCHRLCSHDTQRVCDDSAHFHAVFHASVQEEQRGFQGGSASSRCPCAHFQNLTEPTFSYHGHISLPPKCSSKCVFFLTALYSILEGDPIYERLTVEGGGAGHIRTQGPKNREPFRQWLSVTLGMGKTRFVDTRKGGR